MPGPVSSITSTVPWPSCAGCDAFYASQPTARRSGTRPALCPLRWRALAFVCEVVDRRQARAAQHAGHPANRRAAGLHQSPGRLGEDITVDPHADDHGRKICPAGIGDEIFGSIGGYSIGSAKRSVISPRLFGRWSTQLAFNPDRLLHRAKNNTTSPSYSFQALPIDRRPPRGNHSYTNEGRPRPLGTEPMRILTTRGCDRPISRGVLPSSAVGGIVPGRQGTTSPSIAFASGRELR